MPSEFFKLPAVDAAACQPYIESMKLAWEDLLILSDPEARIAQRFGSEEQCLAALMASLPNPDSFLAGGLQRNHLVLEEYFSLTGNSSRDPRQCWPCFRAGSS